MALDFPSSPSLNQTYTFNGKTWQYNGTGWMLLGAFNLDAYLAAISAAGLTHAANTFQIWDNSNAAVLKTITAFALTFLDDADAATVRTTLGLAIGTDVQAYNANYLKSDTAATVTKGYSATEYNGGNQSGSGTFTPDPANGNFQKVTNHGAWTLAAPSASGSYSIVLDITNDATAGTISVSGWEKQTGDSFDTTNGHKFRCYITSGAAGQHLHVQAMQ